MVLSSSWSEHLHRHIIIDITEVILVYLLLSAITLKGFLWKVMLLPAELHITSPLSSDVQKSSWIYPRELHKQTS